MINCPQIITTNFVLCHQYNGKCNGLKFTLSKSDSFFIFDIQSRDIVRRKTEVNVIKIIRNHTTKTISKIKNKILTCTISQKKLNHWDRPGSADFSAQSALLSLCSAITATLYTAMRCLTQIPESRLSCRTGTNGGQWLNRREVKTSAVTTLELLTSMQQHTDAMFGTAGRNVYI